MKLFLAAIVVLLSACATAGVAQTRASDQEAASALAQTVQVSHRTTLSADDPDLGLPSATDDGILGSGFVVFTETRAKHLYSFIATAAHVCNDYLPALPPDMSQVAHYTPLFAIKRFDGVSMKARLKGFVAEADVCILEVDGFVAPTVKPASTMPPPGSYVISSGGPAGVFGKNLGIVNEGRFGGVTTNEPPYKGRMAVIAGHSFGGASGGPAFYHGRVFGLVRATKTKEGYLVYCVPIDVVQDALHLILGTRDGAAK